MTSLEPSFNVNPNATIFEPQHKAEESSLIGRTIGSIDKSIGNIIADYLCFPAEGLAHRDDLFIIRATAFKKRSGDIRRDYKHADFDLTRVINFIGGLREFSECIFGSTDKFDSRISDIANIQYFSRMPVAGETVDWPRRLIVQIKKEIGTSGYMMSPYDKTTKLPLLVKIDTILELSGAKLKEEFPTIVIDVITNTNVPDKYGIGLS